MERKEIRKELWRIMGESLSKQGYKEKNMTALRMNQW